MERRCLICGKKEQVQYKRLTDSGRYYHICEPCKTQIQSNPKAAQDYKKLV